MKNPSDTRITVLRPSMGASSLTTPERESRKARDSASALETTAPAASRATCREICGDSGSTAAAVARAVVRPPTSSATPPSAARVRTRWMIRSSPRITWKASKVLIVPIGPSDSRSSVPLTKGNCAITACGLLVKETCGPGPGRA